MADAKSRCRLYLQLPASLTTKLETQLSRAMVDTDAACVLLCHDGQPVDEDHAGDLIDLVQAGGLVCLVEKDAALAERLGADGVHLDASAAAYARASGLLGESASIGVGCGLRRHEAMDLAEKGADYVAFGADAPAHIDAIDQRVELIAWWAEIFAVPCVAWNVETADEAARLAGLGADFVAPAKSIWQDDHAASIIADIDNAISRVRRVA
jgi:thiamine-phosphate pyrophosphorylase